MRQIGHLLVQTGRLELAREIRQRRLEHIVVVVMNGDDPLRPDDLHQIDAILAIHRHLEHAKDAGAAQVQQRQVDAGEALRNVLQVVVHQGVAADVHAVARRDGIRSEVKHRTHHGGQQELHAGLAMASGHGREAQARFALLDLELIPFPQADGAPETEFFERGRGFLGGDDGRVLGQLLLDQLVEMVFMQVGEQHEIDRRQLVEFDRRVGQALGCQAIAQVHVVALVQEIRIGEDGKALVADQDGGRADELHAAARFGGRIAARRQLERQHLAAWCGRGRLLGLHRDGDRDGQRRQQGGASSAGAPGPGQSARRHASSSCHPTG